LPSNTVDFSSLTAFKHIIKCVDFTVISSTLHSFFAYWYCEFDVCSSYVLMFFFLLFYFIFFSRATVSAVLQPCRTCHAVCSSCTLCCMCSWQINDDDDNDIITDNTTHTLNTQDWRNER